MAKLTLSAGRDVIEKAKRLAEERGTSVSALFSRYIESIDDSGSRRPPGKMAPVTRRLRGLARVSPERSDRELFEDALLEKHGR
jgi:hypothetical protein